MKIERIFVTGGAGFIGSHFVKLCVSLSMEVIVFELPGVNTDHLPEDEISIIRGDITDKTAINDAIFDTRPDWVIHLAANPNLWARDPDTFEKVNVQGTCHVINATGRAQAKLLYVSTESILISRAPQIAITETTQTQYKDMVGAYCQSKWLAEKAVFEAIHKGLFGIVVNPTVPVGPGDKHQGPLTRMLRDFKAGRIKGYLVGIINLIDVRDVANGILMAMQGGQSGDKFLLGNENWPIQKLFRVLATLTQKKPPKFKISYPVALIFAWLEEYYCRWFKREPMATRAGVYLAKHSAPFNSRSTIQKLGLKLRPTKESLKEMLEEL